MTRIAILGLGKMGTALAGGLCRAGIDAAMICGYDILPAARESFQKTLGAVTVDLMENAVMEADIVILCVKPQNLKEAGAMLSGKLNNALVLSILAGVTLQALSETLGTSRVIRVMPNLPVTVGKGVCCYAVPPGLCDEDLRITEHILSASGLCFQVEEPQMDAVTGLSGSGPAFVMEFLIGLIEGGVRCGLSRDLAQKLACATLSGSIQLLETNGITPETLRQNVISPNGTTFAGMTLLAQSGFAETAAKAVEAAALRSHELGQHKDISKN